MAMKSVLDVEVNDEAFKRFKALFDAYQDELNKIPGKQKRVTEETEATVEAEEEITDEREKQAKISKTTTINAQTYVAIMKATTEQHQKTSLAAAATSRAWSDVHKNIKSVAGYIADMTRALLRWTAVTGVLSGLAGAGGLFGISRLAQSAAAGRRAALGVGTGFGEHRAFGVGFGRFVDPDALLGGVSESLTDPSRRSALIAAGLTPEEIDGKSTAEVSVALLNRTKRLADSTPESMLGSVFQARQLGQFMTPEDFRRLRATPQSEIDEATKRYRDDVVTLNLTKSQQKAWQDLNVQLTRAGQSIEVALIRGLSPLTPQIERLSDAFTKAITAFLSNPKVAEWLNAFAKALETAADYLSSPRFATDMKAFADGIGKLAEKVVSALRYLGVLPSEGEGGSSSDDEAMKELRRRRVIPDPAETGPGQPGWGWSPEKGWHRTPLTPPAGEDADDESDRWIRNPIQFGNLERERGLPAGTLDAVWKIESRRGRNMGPSPAGAEGHFQFMPDTARQYNLDDPYDLRKSSRAAADYISDLKRQFGDVEKALAAYNWGPKRLSDDIRDHGDAWRDYLPRETKKYLAETMPRIERENSSAQKTQTASPVAPMPSRDSGGVKVVIQNNTGGSAVVSTSQLAAVPQ